MKKGPSASRPGSLQQRRGELGARCYAVHLSELVGPTALNLLDEKGRKGRKSRRIRANNNTDCPETRLAVGAEAHRHRERIEELRAWLPKLVPPSSPGRTTRAAQ